MTIHFYFDQLFGLSSQMIFSNSFTALIGKLGTGSVSLLLYVGLEHMFPQEPGVLNWWPWHAPSPHAMSRARDHRCLQTAL